MKIPPAPPDAGQSGRGPGRPALSDAERRKAIALPLSDAERDRITAAASATDQPATVFIRAAALSAADAALSGGSERAGRKRRKR